MIENQEPAAEDMNDGADTYVAPALDVLGTIERLTRGSVGGEGDVPTGVISF